MLQVVPLLERIGVARPHPLPPSAYPLARVDLENCLNAWYTPLWLLQLAANQNWLILVRVPTLLQLQAFGSKLEGLVCNATQT